MIASRSTPAFELGSDGRYRRSATLERVLKHHARRQARVGRMAVERGLKLRKSRGTTPSFYLWDVTRGRIVFPPEWAGQDTYPLACWGGDQLDAIERFLGASHE